MKSLIFLTACSLANAYWLMGIENFITNERIDPIVNPGAVSGHVHGVLGGSNFRFNTNTASLRQSECTSIPIPQDKSNYWFPIFYFQWANGSFTSLNGGAVIYYLFSDTAGTTTAFPDDFRMISGDPTLRTYDSSSFAQQAVTFLCLDFNGVSTRHNSIPAKSCPSGIRAQINFPSCWDGKNLDSADHKSHVAFLSQGPDQGSCSDPKYPVTLPRIFIEVYWDSSSFDKYRSQAMNSSQPFVLSHGDATGYGYHADFINGWDKGVLQRAVDNCHCNPYGDPTCCVQQGLFDMNQGKHCYITKSVDEQTLGTIPKLPGNNPVQPEGTRAKMYAATYTPAILSPVYAYTGNSPPTVGTTVTAAKTGGAGANPTDSSTTTSSNDAPTSTTAASTTTASATPTRSSSTTTSSSNAASTSTTAASTSTASATSTRASSTTTSSASSPSSSGSNGSNPPPSGPSGNNGSSPPSTVNPGHTTTNDKAPTCDLAEFHKRYIASKKLHGRSLRRARRAHSLSI